MIACPNHAGSFDCNPFCPICEGNQEYERGNTMNAEIDYPEISNMHLAINKKQTTFLYLEQGDFVVRNRLTWLPASFSANNREQAQAIMDAIDLLSNHYDPYRTN